MTTEYKKSSVFFLDGYMVITMLAVSVC